MGQLHSHRPLTTIIMVSLLTEFLVFSEQNGPLYSCDSSNPLTESFPFCDAKLQVDKRVEDLISRLTLDEKISQLINTAAAIPRLNISAYQWWSEALHGVSRHGRGIRFNGSITAATMFPQVILTAASFDSSLWYRIGQAIGEEARGVYNAGQAMGMTFWAPNINIFRDPRWGRGQETPGEDPLVAGEYSVYYVRGIQGDSFEGGQLMDGPLKASACCKHFTAHDLDNWNSFDRYMFDANVTKQDLADTYQPPFESCVRKGRASGIMCAYNRVNGVPNCADYDLLTKTARGQWGFNGYIASDCDAVAIMHDNQGYAKLPEDAVADVLKAGMDVNCGSYLMKYTKLAIQRKKVLESDIDRALNSLFSTRIRLGLFDGDPRKQEFGNIGTNHVCSQKNQDLAFEVAKDGIVLLKNSANLLPLSKTNPTSLVVIGPNANTSQTLLGNYEGYPCKNVTLLQALQSYVNHYINHTIYYHQGCSAVNCSDAAVDEAVDLAKGVDYVVLIMGLDQSQEREKHDRTDLVLPGNQESLITSVAQAAKNPVILVVLCGGPVDISFAKENPKIGSILWVGYPGEAGGTALAAIIYGEHNPGGRLPVTWYPKDFIKIPMTDMRMRPEPSTSYPGRTYRFYNGPKVFEFGFGLSYTNYSYHFTSVTQNKLFLDRLLRKNVVQTSDKVTRFLSVSKLGTKLCQRIMLSVNVRVENGGEIDGKHPVLLFVKWDGRGNGNPAKKLIGFKSVSLRARENVDVEFVVNPCEHFSTAFENGLMVLQEGIHYLLVGGEEYLITLVL